MTRKEACDRLELNMDATEADAKKAYFKLIRKYTPERNPDEFASIRAAYEAFQQGFQEDDEEQDPMDGLPMPKNESARSILDSAISLANMKADEKIVENAFSTADLIEKDNPRILANWTQYQLNLDHPGKAAKTAERLIRVCPDWGYAYRLHMIACAQRGWHKKAMDSGFRARAKGIHDGHFLKEFFELLRSQDWDVEALELAPEIYDYSQTRKNAYQDGLTFLVTWADTIACTGEKAKVYYEKLMEFTRKHMMWLSPSPMLSKLVSNTIDIPLYQEKIKRSEFRLLSEWMDILSANVKEKEIQKLIAERRDLLTAFTMDDDDRLEEVWSDYAKRKVAMKDFHDPMRTRFSNLDVELCMIMKRKEILEQMVFVRQDYPTIYDDLKGFLAEMEATEDTQIMLEPRLKEFQKLMKHLHNSRFEKEHPEMLQQPKVPEMFHSWDQGTYVREGAKVGRNDPCPCGSGKKYKNCCMNKGA